MNAFRPLADIAGLLSEVAPAHPAIERFIASPSGEHLSVLFTRLLSMSGDTKERAVAVLKSALNSRQGEPWDTIRKMTEFYPDDNGLFTPLLLNVVELKPERQCSCMPAHPMRILKELRWKSWLTRIMCYAPV